MWMKVYSVGTLIFIRSVFAAVQSGFSEASGTPGYTGQTGNREATWADRRARNSNKG